MRQGVKSINCIAFLFGHPSYSVIGCYSEYCEQTQHYDQIIVTALFLFFETLPSGLFISSISNFFDSSHTEQRSCA